MRHERPSSNGEARSSALWGKGSGGQSRGSALWGRGGRSGIALLALVVSVVIPAAGIAGEKQAAAVPSELLAAAEANPSATFDVIVQGYGKGSKNPGGPSDSDEVGREVRDSGPVKRQFRSISAVSVTLTGKELVKLAKRPKIAVITQDDPVRLASLSGAELWRDAVRATSLFDVSAIPCAVNLLGVQIDPSCKPRAAYTGPTPPAIAIFDSGIDAARTADFGSRVVARANFSSREPNVSGDPLGHGTMVAGIAAGNGSKYPGVARKAPLVDVRVAASTGEALTSDIIAAVDWMLANKGAYNIRVANFSLVSNRASSFRFDPLDRAVEKLWLNGIVVVAAVGNNGRSGTVGIGAPANDPFVITAGALDIVDTVPVEDDRRAPWSAFGPTADGFMKPDLAAPGRWMTAPTSSNSALARKFPKRVVGDGYMWMSGTSFAAPVVAGAAAQVLAHNPGFSPDQVKGALMLTARYVRSQDPQVGVGEIDVAAAVKVSSPPNPNENLYAFVADGEFDADGWADYVRANANWTQANWTSSNWTASNWVASNWVASNWVASNWTASNWVASNWTASNWTVSNEDE